MTHREDVQSYRDLSVWQFGMQIAEDVYQLTKAFPSEERFGLTSQLRRAASSVPANIAEGHARSSTRDFLRHLSIAVGSLAEVTTFLELAQRLQYVEQRQIRGLLDVSREERRMLCGLQASLRRRLRQDR